MSSKYLTAVLAAFVAASPAVAQEERYDNYNDSEFFVLSTDCGSEGQNKIIVFDNGAGKTWLQTNTTRWCDPEGVTINPTEDPIFRSEGS